MKTNQHKAHAIERTFGMVAVSAGVALVLLNPALLLLLLTAAPLAAAAAVPLFM